MAYEKMKAVILAGGLGTRLAEETDLIPKPMVTIGGKPVLWHIMKMYTQHGITDFIICLGYRGYVVKEYFANYYYHMSDVTFDIGANSVEVHGSRAEQWRVTLVDTGSTTMTGGRLRRVSNYLDNQPFCLTYGDGVSDIDISALIRFHAEQKRLATVTAVAPPGRFGSLRISQSAVNKFEEKPIGDGGRINGGFFVFEPAVLDYIDGDSSVLEEEPMRKLVSDGQLSAYTHDGFWQAMDTLRDRRQLEQLWASGAAPWKTW